MNTTGDDSGEPAARKRHRARLAVLRGRLAPPWLSRTEREILSLLEQDESLVAIARAELLSDSRSVGLAALTNRRLLFCGGGVYTLYVRHTPGTYIAKFLANLRRTKHSCELRRVTSVRRLDATGHQLHIDSGFETMVVDARTKDGRSDFGTRLEETMRTLDEA